MGVCYTSILDKSMLRRKTASSITLACIANERTWESSFVLHWLMFVSLWDSEWTFLNVSVKRKQTHRYSLGHNGWWCMLWKINLCWSWVPHITFEGRSLFARSFRCCSNVAWAMELTCLWVERHENFFCFRMTIWFVYCVYCVQPRQIITL